MINRNYNKSEKLIKVKRIIFIIFIFIFLILIFLDINVRPILKKAANYQGKVITTRFIDQATLDTLADEQINYDDLITVSRNKSNEIVGVETNIANINRLKAKLTQSINENFLNLKSFTYNIPVGTLFNSDYFIGRGPLLNLKISPSGFVKTNLVSCFSSVGINQTMHQIILQIEVEISTILTFNKNTSTLKTNYIIAETVIVGNVPNYYNNLLPKQNQISDDLNQYKWSDTEK